MLAKPPRVWLAVVLVIVAGTATVTAVKAQTTQGTPLQLAPLPAGTPADMPPGVDPDQWIPLGEHSGLSIVGRAAQGTVLVRLWVKVGATWKPAILQAPANSVIPAK
jgi:hypothetical protein